MPSPDIAPTAPSKAGGDLAADRYVRLGDVEFEIRKMLPFEAKGVFLRNVRPLIGGALKAGVDLDDAVAEAKGLAQRPAEELSAESATSLMNVVLSAVVEAPTEHYETLCEAMYGSINYRLDGEAWTPLKNNIEHAFADLDVAHIFALDFRAFSINFIGSLPVLLSELKSIVPVSG